MTDFTAAAVDHLAKLVAFDTTSHKSNLAIVEHLEAFLGALGFRLVRLPATDGEAKANLYASIGPEGPGGVILSGHTDVVPVEGQDWSTDPWTLTEKDGRLYGRGPCDMKGFLACCLALAPAMAKADLKRPIRFAFSYDEEVGLRGAPPMVAAMARDLPAHEACIVGEPTRMAVVDGHKGIAWFKTTLTGFEAHSSRYGEGVSAVMMAGRLIDALDRIQQDLITEADPRSPYNPPFTTTQANVVHGGTAMNIMARECVIEWDCRAVPGASAQEVKARVDAAAEAILADMRAIRPEAAIVTEMLADGPPLERRADSPARTLAQHLMGTNEAKTVAYGAESGIFQRDGIDTVVCGPGDIAQAHQPNEFVERDQLAKCCGFLECLVARMAA